MGKTCFFILAELLFLCYFVVEISNAATNLATDQSALLALKAHITQDPHNILSSNWSASTSVCDWIGVHCGRRHPRVTTLNLSMMNLTGTIPPQLGNLSFLTYLDLADNSFHGGLPNELANLRKLRKLDLGDNNFNIEIPPWIGFLSKLIHLKLEQNTFIGTIPASICNISSLQVIRLGVNQLRGSIPSSIFNMSSLWFLSLDNNLLTGPLPTIYKTSLLKIIYMRMNSLSGGLPENLFRYLPQLEWFSLSSNNLKGRIPSTIFTCKKLQVLSLSDNNFTTGSIPRKIGNLTALKDLHLVNSNLIGEIPGEISNLRNLEFINLGRNSLTGQIPKTFGALISLQSLDLSRNNLSGKIPHSLEALKHLKYLNLSFNQLEGEVPKEGPFAKLLAQSFIGNKISYGTPQLQLPLSKSRTHRKTWKTSKVLLNNVLPNYVLPIIDSLMGLALSFVLVLIICRKRNTRVPPDVETYPQERWRRISYHKLLQATHRFNESNLLGKGSFGSVYKGTLEDGNHIAVKAFHLHFERASRSFEAECEALRNIRHRNLVKIISTCSNEDFKALVLEYMPNGTLEKWLHDANYSLDISQRLNVVIDVATALEYLHHNCITPIVHCDLKPSNVLLDECMVGHLSDFGISKLLGVEASVTQTITFATIGYMAPEYGGEGMISIKSDVYSYGIMLMETFTGKKPTEEMFSGETSLKRWVSDSIQNSSADVIDLDLIRVEDRHYSAKQQCVFSILRLAIECTRESPKKRIIMKDVLTRLLKIRKTMLANVRVM